MVKFNYYISDNKKGDDSMAKKRNIIVGQSGGPTSVINSSLAGVYKNAIERGFDKVYGMLHGIQGLLDEQYIDLSTQIHSELDIELLKRTPSAFLGSCRFKLPEIHEDKSIYEKIFDILNRLERYLIIPSADEWTYIRELRNEISHDYPLLETDVAAILNELFSKTDIIFSIYSKLKSVFNNNRHA